VLIFNFQDQEKRLNRNTTVEDVNGKKLPAELIFSMAIRYLKDHFMENVKRQATGLTLDDIHWVITIPAIWEDTAKQFMREAAIKVPV